MHPDQPPYPMKEMPRYQCHKIVRALEIKEVIPAPPLQIGVTVATLVPEEEGFLPFAVSLDYMRKHEPVAGGYYVVYEDGYESFSPAAAFENGYTKIV